MKLADITHWFATIWNVKWGLRIDNISSEQNSSPCHGVTGRAFTNYDPSRSLFLKDGTSDASHAVGGAFQSVTCTKAPSFGIATEAWNFVDRESDSGPLVNEVAVISQHPNKPDIRRRGLDVVFKNRPDTYRYKGVRAGLAENTYNQYANAVVISSQARSTEGEYCGWTAAIRLGPHCLDRSRSQPFAAIIDYRSCGRTADNKVPYRYVWKEGGVEYGEGFDPQALKHRIWSHINTDFPRLVKEW